MSDVRVDSPCIEWTRARSINGYGVASRSGKTYLAHRLAYIDARGPIPEGLTIDHLCRVRSCVNPDHMEVVTRGENARRGSLGTTHGRLTSGHKRLDPALCANGHQLGIVGVHRVGARVRKDGTPYDTCGECHRQACARYRARKRGL